MVKNTPGNAGDLRDTGSIPLSGKFPGGGNANAFQCSCLDNAMDRGAWKATVLRASKSRIRRQLSIGGIMTVSHG